MLKKQTDVSENNLQTMPNLKDLGGKKDIEKDYNIL